MSSSYKTVAILAGGKATRFNGLDKGGILIDGQRLIDIVHDRLKSQCNEIVISGNYDYGLGLKVLPDIDGAPGGPVGGIYSIWKYLESRDVEGFFTAAIDGPNLPSDLIESLYSSDTSTIAIDDNGRHPTLDNLWRRKMWINIKNTNLLKGGLGTALGMFGAIIGTGLGVYFALTQ